MKNFKMKFGCLNLINSNEFIFSLWKTTVKANMLNLVCLIQDIKTFATSFRTANAAVTTSLTLVKLFEAASQ